MINSIEYFRTLILHYPYFEYLLIFLGVAIGGEIAILAFAFLAAQHFLSLWALCLFGFMATLFSDSFWFLLGRTKIIQKIISHRHMEGTVSVVSHAISRMSRGSHMLSLILGKFMVGTRIVILLYMSKSHLLFKDFIRFNIVAILVWLLIVIPIGFISGLGYSYLGTIFQNLYVGLGFILLIIIVIIIGKAWLNRKLIEKQSEK